MQREKCQKAAQQSIPDFTRILGKRKKPITPAEVRLEHEKDVAWLDKQLSQVDAPATVVVTHFAPTARSMMERKGNDPLSAYWANANDRQVAKANLWLHGHIHANRHYRLDYAPEHHGLVLSNPRGFIWHQTLSELPEEVQTMLKQKYPNLDSGDWLEVPENQAFCNPLRFVFDPNNGSTVLLPSD